MATLNLAAIIEQHARRRPDRVAVVFGETRMTFGELDAWANRIAGGLAASGIRRGDHVALLCPNLPYFPAAYFGILKTGATVVPLNVLLTPREIAYHLRDSDAKALLCFEGTAGAAHGRSGQGRRGGGADVRAADRDAREGSDAFTNDPDVSTLAQLTAGHADAFDTVATSPEDTAVILYTSGTTGQPKGAELTHLNMTQSSRYEPISARSGTSSPGEQPARPVVRHASLPDSSISRAGAEGARSSAALRRWRRT